MNPVTDAEPTQLLLGYLTGARWFAGKGRQAELARVTALPWLTDAEAWPAVRFELAEVHYPVGASATDEGGPAADTELYQLALSYWPQPQPGLAHAEVGRLAHPELGSVVVYDAMQDPRACTLVLEHFLKPRRFSSDSARVSFHLVTADVLTSDLEPRIYTGQQSNTSVMYGEVAMLKLFRRLEIGHNLDIEVHESLSRSGVGDVAQLYGFVEATWDNPASDGPDTLTADLGMVVEKLAEAEDGWELALGELRQGRDFREQSRALGRALAEIHLALREAFPTGEVAGQQVAETMARRLDAAAGVAEDLGPLLRGLRSAFGTLSGETLATQRVHGDFHLGQTLMTPSGWKIIDFEGEPVKSLAERAEPDSVWRDIAGMLRSFDYAAASVPGPSSQAWADACRAAFLQGYVDGPLDAADEAVLTAYVADKAVYEVVYEVRNRPDWVSIPLAAVSRIADAGLSQDSTPAPAGATDAAAESAAPTTPAPSASVKE